MTKATEKAGIGIFEARERLVLASGSPRRRELLGGLGIVLEVRPVEVEEPLPEPGEGFEAYALRMAELKGRAALREHAGTCVLAADTVVALDDEIMGKPVNEADALGMLKRLAGREHVVCTGCFMAAPGRGERLFAASTTVRMAPWSGSALAAYVSTGEPMGKAGAYAIQGRAGALVESVRGSYTNVVGLPVAKVVEILVEWGVVAPEKG